MQDYDELWQIQGRLSHLMNQIERMQWEVARLSLATQASNSKISALTKHIINSEAQAHIHEKLAEFLTQLETSQEKLDDLSEPQKRIHEKLAEFLTQLETSQERLDDLTKTVKKLSRTQFKANALGESKEQQVSETVALLRDIVTKREELKETQKIEEQQRIAELQDQARGELATDFLPVLDGIERALEHKIPLPAEESEQPDTSPGLFQKILKSFAHAPDAHRDKDAQKLTREMYETITGWLRGLEIIRERFLRLLEREGIERIPDINQQFDPHLHVAIDTEERTDVAENTIVSVIRKGYIYKERVLRYSEVIVAKSPQEQVEITHQDNEAEAFPLEQTEHIELGKEEVVEY